MSAKQMRYTLTRLCLDTGSIAILKYLEPFIPTESTLSAALDGGRELNLDIRNGRVYGFTDFFAQQKVSVNDALMITPLESNRWQLEIAQKARAIPAATLPVVAAAAMESIIEDESTHIRVVRKQPATVSPYPNGILYPGSEKTENKIEAPTQISKPEPAPQPTALSKISSPKTISPLEPLLRSFSNLGYLVSPLETGLQLEVRLPRGTHKIAVALEGFSDISAVLKAGRLQGAKYLAVAASADRMNFVDTATAFGNIARVELEALSTLEKLQEHFALTPLELEGYWNAGGIRQESLESIQHSINQRLETRGEFSFVMLALRHFSAPCLITPEDIVAKLPGSGIGTSNVLQVLETLSKAPFMMVTPLGMGEYHLKMNLERGLEELSSYVSSVKMRIGATAPVKADNTLIRA